MCTLDSCLFIVPHITLYVSLGSGVVAYISSNVAIVVQCDINILLSSNVYFPIVFDNDPTFQRKPAIEVMPVCCSVFRFL